MTYPVGPLQGGLAGGANLTGRLTGSGSLSGGLSMAATTAPEYAGPYEVTPTFDDQLLGTQGKVMRSDVTVHEIPVTRTSNPYDGITVLIG